MSRLRTGACWHTLSSVSRGIRHGAAPKDCERYQGIRYDHDRYNLDKTGRDLVTSPIFQSPRCDCTQEMCASMCTMSEGCHPFIFYHRVRPFLRYSEKLLVQGNVWIPDMYSDLPVAMSCRPLTVLGSKTQPCPTASSTREFGRRDSSSMEVL